MTKKRFNPSRSGPDNEHDSSLQGPILAGLCHLMIGNLARVRVGGGFHIKRAGWGSLRGPGLILDKWLELLARDKIGSLWLLCGSCGQLSSKIFSSVLAWASMIDRCRARAIRFSAGVITVSFI
jgi:hypothetical protein